MRDIPEGEQKRSLGKKVRSWLLEWSEQSLKRQHKHGWGPLSSRDLPGSPCTVDPQRARSCLHPSLWPVLLSGSGMALRALLRANHESPI